MVFGMLLSHMRIHIGFRGAKELKPPPTKGDDMDNNEDICGFCGEPGADKIPHPVRWPGECSPNSEYVHRHCEELECQRAHSMLSDSQRKQFLKTV